MTEPTKTFDTRPWGTWEILHEAPYCKVKKITVKPQQRLSYQSHKKREEHWTIVQGRALVTLDDETTECSTGQHIHIPREAKHRIENPDESTPLIFIEVQTGTYFGEDDIIRFEDDYGRN